ncbi:leucine-rich repeat-containing protein 74A-like isoform X3 [Montipora capricornis]
MHTRNATVKKVDKTLKALSSVSRSAKSSQTLLKPEASSSTSGTGLRADDSGEESDGWETDLECDEDFCQFKPKYDPTGRTLYQRACQKLGIVPASYFARHMVDQTVMMSHHGLGPLGIRAMALALLYNTKVTNLNIRDNGIGEEGGEIMAKLLRENYFIVELDMSENQLGRRAVLEIAETLKENNTLTKLALAGNSLDDKDAEIICQSLLLNNSLTHLDLSSNKFSNTSCAYFAKMLDENITLLEINLSWNHIQVRGGQILAKGLQGNVKLKSLNLAWNGLASEGAKAIAGALVENATLQVLDLSSNRISDTGAFKIARYLENSSSLEVVRLAKNNLQNNGACAILNAIMKNGDSRLTKVDLTGVIVENEFHIIVDELKTLREIEIITDEMPEVKKKEDEPDPATLLRNYIAKENVLVVDLFRKLDHDGSMQVSVKEFAEGLRKSNVGLTQFEVDKIIDMLDADKDGEIDYSEFVCIQSEWKSQEKGTRKISNNTLK